MWIRILGSAADGGFPHWNCHCPNCQGLRDGLLSSRPRTQSSIAVSADYYQWYIFNASPDIMKQIEAFEPLWPQGNGHHRAIQAVILTDAELEHSLGLLSLRNGGHLQLYTTQWVRQAIMGCNPILPTLQSSTRVDWKQVYLGEFTALPDFNGANSGLQFKAFTTQSMKPLDYANLPPSPESVVGIRIVDTKTGGSLV